MEMYQQQESTPTTEKEKVRRPRTTKIAGAKQQEVAPEETPVTEPVGKTEELPAAEGNPFEEISDANKLKGTAKTNAIKDLKQKYGADYNRISKIDTNFASIVKTLEKNNLINKDCG
jgi:hypothetical protein